MSTKHDHNLPPSLPEAVLNLLALHGLRAEPVKQRFRNATWIFNILPDRPVPSSPPAKQRRWVPVFQGRPTQALEYWIEQVKRYEARRSAEDQVLRWIKDSGGDRC